MIVTEKANGYMTVLKSWFRYTLSDIHVNTRITFLKKYWPWIAVSFNSSVKFKNEVNHYIQRSDFIFSMMRRG